MGYFFRRSARLGPFRLNFSKSGIGASVGVKGARLTMTPRGTTYVTVGSHGFYYRETLSGRSRPPVSDVPAPASPALYAEGTIETASAADLVESSRENLIRELNERARMFNPAWLLYGLAALATFIGLSSALSRESQDLSNLALGRRSNTVDEYSILVARYGYPDLITVDETEPPASVPLRIAEYKSARVKMTFVPNGCVQAYENPAQPPKDPKKRRALYDPASSACVPLSSGWTIVRYINATEGWSISVEIAVELLDASPQRTSLPDINGARSVVKKNSKSRGLSKKQPPSEMQVDSQLVALEKQRMQSARSAEQHRWYTTIAVIVAGIGLFGTGIAVHKANTRKRLTRLFYELDDVEQAKQAIVHGAFTQLGQSHVIWRVNAESATSDWKRNAGASSLVRRSQITVGFATPDRVETNVRVPCINLGRATLFFLPDVILYSEGGTFGGVSYDDFRVQPSVTQFIEDGFVPRDGTVVSQTWRYVNRNGGPDRRFNNNRQLPVMRYGVVVLSSSRGLNIHLNTSNQHVAQSFASSWHELHQVGRMPPPRSGGPSGGGIRSAAETQALKVLGLSDNATAAEISTAYRRLAQMYHPDKVAGLASEFQVLADTRMKEINAAYELLKGRANSAQSV